MWSRWWGQAASCVTPQLLLQGQRMSCSACVNAALGLMRCSMPQIAVGGNHNQLKETVHYPQRNNGSMSQEWQITFQTEGFKANRIIFGVRKKKVLYLSGIRMLFLNRGLVSLSASILWVSTHPAYKALPLTIEQTYLVMHSSNFEHICSNEWVYGKCASPLEFLDTKLLRK